LKDEGDFLVAESRGVAYRRKKCRDCLNEYYRQRFEDSKGKRQLLPDEAAEDEWWKQRCDELTRVAVKRYRADIRGRSSR
jgi:hypothetical protein